MSELTVQKSNSAGQQSRRELLKGASVLAGIALPHVYAAENNTVEVALVGAGGRGTGAAANALSVENGPTKLVAIADVVPKKLNDNYDKLKTQFGAKVDVPQERRFLGFEAYKQAMDALKPGGIVILGTPPAFCLVHFK